MDAERRGWGIGDSLLQSYLGLSNSEGCGVDNVAGRETSVLHSCWECPHTISHRLQEGVARVQLDIVCFCLVVRDRKGGGNERESTMCSVVIA